VGKHDVIGSATVDLSTLWGKAAGEWMWVDLFRERKGARKAAGQIQINVLAQEISGRTDLDHLNFTHLLEFTVQRAKDLRDLDFMYHSFLPLS